jgi:PAS domain S-box-containing protein
VPDLKDFSVEEIFNQSPEPIMMLEIKNGMPTRYAAVNQAYADQLGYSREECLQLDPNSVMPQSFLDNVPSLMKAIYRDKHVSYDVERIGKEDIRIPVHVDIFLFKGEPVDIILVMSYDKSREKQLETELQQFYWSLKSPLLISLS